MTGYVWSLLTVKKDRIPAVYQMLLFWILFPGIENWGKAPYK